MPSPRLQSGLLRRAVAVLTLLAVAPLGACSGDDDDAAAPPATEKIDVPGADVTLSLARINVLSAGEDKTLDEKTKLAVMKQTRSYVEQAIVRPLLQGKQAGKSYGDLFADDLRRLATRGDRDSMTDEFVGKVTADLRAPKTKVVMSALVDGGGNLQYVATNFGMKLHSEIDGTPLRINRATELIFEKNAQGKWVVNGYRVVATRSAGAAKRSTTASSETEKS
jgi:hypothetical protein